MKRLAAVLLILAACSSPDEVYDVNGALLYRGPDPFPTIAQKCLGGYEEIVWRDFGRSCVYRCKGTP